MNTRLAGYVSRAAYLSGIMGILGFVALVLFFALEAPQAAQNREGFYSWGTLSDLSGPLSMLPLLVVVVGLHQMLRSRAPTASRIAAILGVAGILGVSILSILLVARVLSFEQQVGPVVLANAVVGVWVVIVNHLARVQLLVPARLAWLGTAAGVSFILSPVLFAAMGGADFYSNMGSNYLFLTASSIIVLLTYLGFPIWAIWLGRLLSARRAHTRAGVVYAE